MNHSWIQENVSTDLPRETEVPQSPHLRHSSPTCTDKVGKGVKKHACTNMEPMKNTHTNSNSTELTIYSFMQQNSLASLPKEMETEIPQSPYVEDVFLEHTQKV